MTNDGTNDGAIDERAMKNEERLTMKRTRVSMQTPRRIERRPVTPESERRRSTRERKTVSYVGMDDGSKDREDVTFSRARVARAPKERSPRATYSVGGRVYDSELGVTCHWCRQKTVETHVQCVGEACQGARLPLSFCGMCLRNRHGEDIDDAVASGCWECPRCRGSCGEGCVTCCNCGPCRKKAGLSPTHQIIGLARANGFDNVHDYLVHQATGENAEDIAARKLSFSWGKWLRDDFCRPVEQTAIADQRRVVDVTAGSSADEEYSVRDVDTPSDSNASESDDDQFMVVQRTPQKKRSTAEPESAFASPAKKSRARTPSPKKSSPSPKKRTVSSPKKHSAPSTPEPLREYGEDVYEFERVLATRKRGRGEQLLVKWKGFGEDEATWEPKTNIIFQ